MNMPETPEKNRRLVCVMTTYLRQHGPISPRFLCRPTALYIFARAVGRSSKIYNAVGRQRNLGLGLGLLHTLTYNSKLIYSKDRLRTKLYDKRDYSHCELSIYMYQHSSSTCTLSIYLSVDPIFQSLWFLSGLP